VEDFVQAVQAVVKVDEDWIPTDPGTSLYIRPFIIATEPFLGVDVSDTFLFMIILSPSGAYYESGLEPVGIWIEDDYVRAVKGGMGYAKTGGNYAASLAAQVKAHNDGYSQVLWLDGVERKYIEEVGAMNIFFKIDGKILTPMLNGSILPGITRNSVLQLCRSWGMDVEERRISVDELIQAQKDGKLEECFGTGTAAVISPVGKLRYKDDVMVIGDNKIGPVSQKLYDTVTGIQLGNLEDTFGWRVEVK
jgi:branched-chain amino acid aminotransferase